MTPRKKKPSLLARLFGGGKTPQKSTPRKKPSSRPEVEATPRDRVRAAAVSSAPPAPPSPLERSIREIKQMAGMGEKDPERLALMLSRLLSKERQKRDEDKDKLGEMVKDILRRHPPEDGRSAPPTS